MAQGAPPPTASFHSPRAFKSSPAPPACSIRGPPAPPAGPSKKSDRQAGGARQPTRCPESRPQPRSSEGDQQGLVAKTGPILGRSFSAQSATRTGKEDTPTLLGDVPGRGTTDAGSGDRRGGRGRILDNPTHGAAECTPSLEGSQANVRRRDLPPRKITRHLPRSCHHSLGVPGETPFVNPTPTPTPTPTSFSKNNVQYDK